MDDGIELNPDNKKKGNEVDAALEVVGEFFKTTIRNEDLYKFTWQDKDGKDNCTTETVAGTMPLRLGFGPQPSPHQPCCDRATPKKAIKFVPWLTTKATKAQAPKSRSKDSEGLARWPRPPGD